ncbi:MAG TPA: oxidoreductase [Arachidicoccus sp.]
MKKIVFVTGASAGIGKATAKHLAQNGYTVYAAARRAEKMNDLLPLGVKVIPLDVTSDALMVDAVSQIVDAEGKIDVLVNNAGFGSYGAIEDVPMADAKYQLEVNVFGAARLIQLVLPYMRKRGYGKIVNISSVGGKFATPLGGWYHASKFAVEGLSDSLRNEVKDFGIDVIIIEPGGIKSEWGGIANESMIKVSGDTAYKPLVDKLSKTLQSIEMKLPEPLIIAALIKKAIEAKEPKARYVAGYMAKSSVIARKLLSDKMMDKMLKTQMK